MYDRVNTKFGKLRILLVAGYLIEALALYGMFTGFSSKGLGLPVFALLYIVYIIGYTITNMTAQTIPAIMTNDPRQRPTIGVWTTAFNYLVPMAMSMIFNVVLLPKCGGTYNQAFLSAACNMTLLAAGIGTVLVCLGVSAYDKPETFVGTKKSEPLKMSDIIEVLKHNRPLQCYIASNASDKLAQQVASQAIINTLFNGILIGNMGLATILTVISMVPSIFFAAFGAKYVGKHGSKNGIVTWTYVSMTITAVLVLFFIFGDPTQIGVMGSPSMILYVVLTLLQNGSNMCITTSNTSYTLLADADFLAVGDLVRNAGRLAALRADDHDLAGIDRGFGLDDAALILLIFRLLVLRGDVHALHDELAALRVSRQDFAFLALVLAGQDNDFIVFFDVHVLRPPQITSGARDRIFVKSLSRSSRATGPKIRVPRGFLSSPLIRTAAFSSKRT